MNYWLMKTEPDAFSLEDLKNAPKQTTLWDGVRNYQARNIMRDEMKLGDKVFFYHSRIKPPSIVAIAKVVKESHPDPSQFDEKSKYYDPKASPEKPRWFCVDIQLERELKQAIGLDELKKHAELADMPLLQKGQRLSVQPVSPKHWTFILQLIA
ncbi:EVE domain-containing protein [bacterium]|nr:EVE domain-containing protein [bacterium]